MHTQATAQTVRMASRLRTGCRAQRFASAIPSPAQTDSSSERTSTRTAIVRLKSQYNRCSMS